MATSRPKTAPRKCSVLCSKVLKVCGWMLTATTAATSVLPLPFRQDSNAATTSGSISSMACGFNIIAVGSYGTCSQWNDLSGGSHGTGSGEGTLSSFSSWGELVDGRKLPHVCAPGGGINSSVSGPYIAKSHGGGKPSRLPQQKAAQLTTGQT